MDFNIFNFIVMFAFKIEIPYLTYFFTEKELIFA